MLNYIILEFEQHAETVHSHLLQMMDPSKHVHPGIPYDFYEGYVVVESENVDESNQRNVGSLSQRGNNEETVIIGKLPQSVRMKLEQQWGKYQFVNDNKVK